MEAFSDKFIPPFIIGKGKCFKDDRGAFIPLRALEGTIQCNISISKPKTVRGIHWQMEHPQAKLISCLTGKIHDVCIDLRNGSPSHGDVFEFELEGGSGEQLFVPEGFGHGFEVVGEKGAMILYMVSKPYLPNDEGGFFWKSVPADWVTKENEAILSEKDAKLPKWDDVEQP